MVLHPPPPYTIQPDSSRHAVLSQCWVNVGQRRRWGPTLTQHWDNVPYLPGAGWIIISIPGKAHMPCSHCGAGEKMTRKAVFVDGFRFLMEHDIRPLTWDCCCYPAALNS